MKTVRLLITITCPRDLLIVVSGVNMLALVNVGLIIVSLIIISPDVGVNTLYVSLIPT